MGDIEPALELPFLGLELQERTSNDMQERVSKLSESGRAVLVELEISVIERRWMNPCRYIGVFSNAFRLRGRDLRSAPFPGFFIKA